jgi:hypothetical protein
MKYTAEEVRQYARITDGMVSLSKLTDMLTELAERIEADEGVVPVAYQSKRRPEDYPDEWRECSKETFDTIKRMKDSPWIVRELFTHPPAQATQSCEKCKGRGEVFNDVHVRMMTCPHCPVAGKVAPAKPAAQVGPAAKPRTLADFVNAADAERVQIGQQVAARMNEMMAEPAAQGDDADGWCDCCAMHTIDEIDSGQCDCCGKPISPEEYP